MGTRLPFFFHMRTKLIVSYAGIIVLTVLIISVVFFTTSKQIITRHVLEQDQFLVEQISLNTASQLRLMEELQFNQYRYSLLGDMLNISPAGNSERLNQTRRITESLIRLCHSNMYIDSAVVIDNDKTIYNYMKVNDHDLSVEIKDADSGEFLDTYGKAHWTIGDGGKLIMHRLLLNINTTRTVGRLLMAIDSRYLTRIYEPGMIEQRGTILIFDKTGNFIPSENSDINDMAPFLFESSEHKNNSEFSFGGEQYIVTLFRLYDDEIEIYHVVSLRELGIYTRTLPLITSLAAIAAVIATIIVAHIISSRLTGGINLLVKGIRRFADGDLKTPVHVKSNDEFGYLAEEFNKMADAINGLIKNIYDVELKKRKAETNALKFEYSALESKINPHFIYNALESVNSLAKLKGANDISQIVCLLGILLRDNISSTVEVIPLEKEMDNVSKYLQIQKLAYGEKFEVHIFIDNDAREAMVPKFILQPLVENALYHGVLVSTKQGNLFLDARLQNMNLNIIIRDNGAGMNRGKLLELLDYSLESKKEGGTHAKVGVRAIDRRLKILYGDEYGLKIQSEENEGTTVTLIMPFFTAEREKIRLVDDV